MIAEGAPSFPHRRGDHFDTRRAEALVEQQLQVAARSEARIERPLPIAAVEMPADHRNESIVGIAEPMGLQLSLPGRAVVFGECHLARDDDGGVCIEHVVHGFVHRVEILAGGDDQPLGETVRD